jgi:ABC-2 type transport system permease protein
MNQLIRGELLKLRTTRGFWINAISAILLVPLSVTNSILTAGKDGGGPALDTSEGLRGVMSAASAGSIVVLILGILLTAGEFRHGTVTSTFLVTPRRAPVVAAKLAAGAIVGAVLSVVASVLTLAVALPWLAAKDVHVSLLGGDVVPVLLGAGASTILYAMIGVGVGFVLRNQTTAIVVALIWVMVVEGLLVGFVPAFGRWLPGGAAASLSGVASLHGDLLPMWAAALVFAAYAAAFAMAGTRAIVDHDIT